MEMIVSRIVVPRFIKFKCQQPCAEDGGRDCKGAVLEMRRWWWCCCCDWLNDPRMSLVQHCSQIRDHIEWAINWEPTTRAECVRSSVPITQGTATIINLPLVRELHLSLCPNYSWSHREVREWKVLYVDVDGPHIETEGRAHNAAPTRVTQFKYGLHRVQEEEELINFKMCCWWWRRRRRWWQISREISSISQ